MRIGTPLTPGATRVMLLGSGELGKEVAIELQRLGVEVIAVDRYPNAPAHQVAHRSHVVTMTDPAALRAVIALERPHIVVPEIEAIATDVLAQIEAEGLAIVIPTARATQLTMNREGIRRLAAETLGLPTSAYGFAGSRDELAAEAARVGFPCFVKPVMSSSGKGQSYVETPADIDAAWDYALAGGRVEQTRVIVEARIDFDFEITLLTVRARGASGQVETRFCAPIGHRQVKGDYVESWQPQAMSETALARARAIAETVTGDLGGLGVFGVELFVKGDEVWFSEVSPRPHDTGLVTLVTQALSEFALHARAILGLPVDTALRETGASAVIYGGLEAEGIAFEGVDEALAVEGVELRLFGKPESFVRRRMGVALARGGRCGSGAGAGKGRGVEGAAGSVLEHLSLWEKEFNLTPPPSSSTPLGMTDLPTLDGPRAAPASGQPAKSLVILLHGYGSNGEDLISLAPYWSQALPDTAFVSPNAPQVCPGAPGGYQWWSLMDGGDRATGANSAAPILNAFIDAELARHGLGEDRLALVGFSQGTMMALHVGPWRERPLAGIVGFSGMLVDEAALAASPTKPPVLLVHGDADAVVPVAAFYAAKTALEQADFPLISHTSPGLGHGIDPAGLKLGAQFLRQVLG